MEQGTVGLVAVIVEGGAREVKLDQGGIDPEGFVEEFFGLTDFATTHHHLGLS